MGKGRPKGFKHSAETRAKISRSNTGVLSSQWAGNKARYQAVHCWLRRHYGNADCCEAPDCPKVSTNYEWALKRGEKHGHFRERYLKMCKSCHRIYDDINRWRRGEKIIKPA